MHDAAYRFIAAAAGRRPRGLVLEIGGRDINGSVRALFRGDPYLSIDTTAGPGVDRVANGATFTPAVPPACIVCCEVLEHTPSAAAIVAHAAAILAPGGTLLVTAAGPSRAPHSAVDGGPVREGEYYQNVTAGALRTWLEGLPVVVVQETPDGADVYAWAVREATA